MKRFLFITGFTFFFLPCFCEPHLSAKPFIVKGQLTHLSAGQIIFFFRDSRSGYKEYIIDTAHVDSVGNFYLKTFKITEPVRATLRKEFLSINLYAAPGYDLTIKGDVSDMEFFQQHKKITGAGALPNLFLCKSDSLEWAATAKDSVNWGSLPLPKVLIFANQYKHSRDSLHHLIFSQQQPNDKWFTSFDKMTQLDSRFMKMYYLIYGVMQDKVLTYQQSISFVNKNVEPALLKNLYDNNYLVSEDYRSWLTGTYPNYLRELQERKQPGYKNEKEADVQLIDQIAKNYRNKIREIRLYNKLEQTIQYCPSFEDLSLYKEKLPAYISLLKDNKEKKKLDSLLSAMEGVLLTTQIGKPAPVFTAFDSTGKSYSLQDYNGKVIYLDLWASWCVPCREETPYLKLLTEKYKDNNNIIFVSVAVLDDLVRWKKALISDAPGWLQLFDKNRSVQIAYSASAVPKFILINKKGDIVSFDAPKPSDILEVEAMINKELQN
ncbi:MAG: TlpA disulfide reductase family protein [Ferruginibacter sp.]